jgi:hypothetical protein
MQVLDYGRSYLFFTARGRSNTARLQVEARCELLDRATGEREEYLFFASCKAENTHVRERLFQNPNYDFCGVFSAREFVLFRTPAAYETDPNSVGLIEEYFASAHHAFRWQDGRLLESAAQVTAATLAGTPLVGRTEWESEEAELRAVLEYPIKTMNVHPQDDRFQVDTGPLPFPDPARPGARWIERLLPAYIAWNRPDRAELILQRPTPVVRDGREVCRVLHYSEIRVLTVRNVVLRVED